MDIKEKLKNLSLSEKAELVSGQNSWYTYAVPRLDIRPLYLTDGPLGVRAKKVKKGKGSMGLGSAIPSTSFPSPENLSATWDRALCEKVGDAIGKEAASLSVDVLLAPGVNVQRDPRLGRNFEYWSEDPLLAGELAAAYVEGVQSEGVSVCVKHFALNNSENFRYVGDSLCDERAKREIYLSPFERVIKKARPDSVMCAYNQIDGEFCSDSKRLLTDILRDEWGFDGTVITDWGATHDRIRGILAGCDLDMPGGVKENKKKIISAVKKGELSEDALDLCVARILALEEKHKEKKQYDLEELYGPHAKLALEAALRSAVLLENDGTLPLSKDGKYVVIGELFEHMRYQGNGSSRLSPARLKTPSDAFREMGIDFAYAAGYRERETEPNETLEKHALELVNGDSMVLIFAGLCDISESEGIDREDINLAANQLSLINKVKKITDKVVIVLFDGSPVNTSFCESTDAVLNMYLPGEMGGEACAKLLFGECSPSGHLTETWPEKLGDVPDYDCFNKSKNVLYKESVFVGYRYYATSGTVPKYPFGYGLSYTKFECGAKAFLEGDTVKVTVKLKNAGEYDSYATVQVYSGKNENTAVFKPKIELCAFESVFLKSGEEKTATLEFDKRELAYYNEKAGFVIENGIYPILVSLDGKSFSEAGEIAIEGETDAPSPYDSDIIAAYNNIGKEKIPDGIFEKLLGHPIPAEKEDGKFTLESTFEDMESSLVGKAIKRGTDVYVSMQRKKYEKLPEGPEKDELFSGTAFIESLVMKNSPRSLIQSSGGIAQMGLARFAVRLANLTRKKKKKDG